MSDASKLHEGEPHPDSSHRSPREIAEDEAGPIGDGRKAQPRKVPADQGPVRKVGDTSQKKSSKDKP